MTEIEIPVSALKFVNNTRLPCMHGCLHYRRNPMCPPACQDLAWYKQLLNSYENVKIQYNFADYTDAIDLTIKRNSFHTQLLEIEQRLKRSGNYYALGFFSGACTMCDNKACSLDVCDRALTGRTPVCAVGIDLSHLCKEILNLPKEDMVSFWKSSMSQDLFVNTPHRYLCLGLIFY